MDNKKMVAIQQIVDSSIKSFADGFELRYNSEVNQPNGVNKLKEK